MTILLALIGVYVIIGLLFVGVFKTVNDHVMGEENKLHGVWLFMGLTRVFFTWPGIVFWAVNNITKKDFDNEVKEMHMRNQFENHESEADTPLPGFEIGEETVEDQKDDEPEPNAYHEARLDLLRRLEEAQEKEYAVSRQEQIETLRKQIGLPSGG